MPSQKQIRETLTNQIVCALSNGGLPPWRRPWSSVPAAGPACNGVSRRKYRGVNPLLLAIAAMRHDLMSKYWGTFDQWKALGGRVKKRPGDVRPGHWGTRIIFWSKVTKTEKNEYGEDEERDLFFMRTYTVFNVDQVEGYALGELMAEIGSCYLADELGIPMADTSVNHQAYIACWLQGLQNDHRFIFQAASQASNAVDYLLSFARQPVNPPDAVLV